MLSSTATICPLFLPDTVLFLPEFPCPAPVTVWLGSPPPDELGWWTAGHFLWRQYLTDQHLGTGNLQEMKQNIFCWFLSFLLLKTSIYVKAMDKSFTKPFFFHKHGQSYVYVIDNVSYGGRACLHTPKNPFEPSGCKPSLSQLSALSRRSGSHPTHHRSRLWKLCLI